MATKTAIFLERLENEDINISHDLLEDAASIHELLVISEYIVQTFDSKPCFEHVVQVFDRLCERQLWSTENSEP